MSPHLALAIILLGVPCFSQVPDTVRLSSLDLSAVRQGWGTAKKDAAVDDHPITIGGRVFAHGVGTHARSTFKIALNKGTRLFLASVGIDAESVNRKGASADFSVVGDGKTLWQSRVLHSQDTAVGLSVDVSSVDTLELRVGDGGDGIDWDHADWAEARFVVTGARPVSVVRKKSPPYILTPLPPNTPRLTGPRIVGARVGNPLLFTVTATGKRPLTFHAAGLPKSLTLDSRTGQITGKISVAGEFAIEVTARNRFGESRRSMKIISGSHIALTPPLGWNSWNCFAEAVDEQKVRSAADALVSSGLADHGWSYINIDDCWMVKPGSTDSLVGGPSRNADGTLRSNKKFPDMKALASYIHSRGLKAGLYSSPGKLTCAEYTACYGHEKQDAATFASWGFDYLKYDWCSYEAIAKDHSLPELQKPYQIMREALDRVPRDIVFSLCQYGMGDVWQWGEHVGGNCWRTTGDISDSWESVESIGFSQAGHEQNAGPGHWNDPDMLVVGKVGWGPELHATSLSADEQYTHISLWSLLAAPLLIGCDLTQLDPFTLSLLTNDEVLEINQDPLGIQARRVAQKGEAEIWSKPLEDGSLAVGLFNRSEAPAPITATWNELGIAGNHVVRDAWRHKNVGVFADAFQTEVPSHGVVLLKISRAADRH